MTNSACFADARGVVIDPDDYSVHDVTSTLKQFLRSLPDPVLTHARYSDFIAVIRTSSFRTINFSLPTVFKGLNSLPVCM